MPGRDGLERGFSFADRDEDSEDLPSYGGGGGRASYDDDEDEDGSGWALNKDHTESLWDSAEDHDDDDEEPGLTPEVTDDDDEEADLFAVTAPRRRGRPRSVKPAPPVEPSIFETGDVTGLTGTPSTPGAAQNTGAALSVWLNLASKRASCGSYA